MCGKDSPKPEAHTQMRTSWTSVDKYPRHILEMPCHICMHIHMQAQGMRFLCCCRAGAVSVALSHILYMAFCVCCDVQYSPSRSALGRSGFTVLC